MSLCCISFRSILKLVSSVPWPPQFPANILSNVIMCIDAIIELQGVFISIMLCLEFRGIDTLGMTKKSV